MIVHLKFTGTIKKLLSAYLLVFHGSRDRRYLVAVEQLTQLVCDVQMHRQASGRSGSGNLATHSAETFVGMGLLELHPLPLHEQIREFAERSFAAGIHSIQVVPVFLLPGVHVMEDIPAEVARAQQALGSQAKIEIKPYLGKHPGLTGLLSAQQANMAADAWILLSHGSRRAGANQPIEEMAIKLGAVPAYWSMRSSLEKQVEALVNAGHRRIGILPYFLFAGAITDAISQYVSELSQRFPAVELQLAEPLGAGVALARLISDLAGE